MDELWTLDAVSRSFKEMIGARLVSDSKPPIWSMLSWVWLRLAGTYDAATMRLLPLVFSLLAIGAPLLGAVRLRSLRPAMLVMAALMALSLSAVHFATELRSYSMMIACGSAASVVWAGLLSGDLSRHGRWIFLFAFLGAMAGFAHYYGHLLYVGELGILGLLWVRAVPRRPLGILLAWGGLSLVPIALWYALTRAWFPTQPVAGAPEWSIVQTWLSHSLGPVTNVVANQVGVETLLAVISAAAIGGAVLVGVQARRTPERVGRAHQVGAAALAVVAAGVVGAWTASLILPPSMNFRNLAGLLPALLLGIACAATPGRAEGPGRWGGAAVVAVWIAASAAVIGQFGVTSLAPPWQIDAGYRETVRLLVASARETPAPALIGLKMPWDWHGQWDAAIRSELGDPPAESGAPVPLAVRWIMDVGELQSSDVPSGPLIAFTDASDSRSVALFAWLQEVRVDCEPSLIGGLGFGVVNVVRCPGGP